MDLVIVDEFIKEDVASFLFDNNNKINDVIYEYMEIMREVKEKGIQTGKTADALEEFINQVNNETTSKESSLSNMGNQVKRFCDNFITKVDKADKNLY